MYARTSTRLKILSVRNRGNAGRSQNKKNDAKVHPVVEFGGEIDCKIIEYLWDLIDLIPEAVKETKKDYKSKT